MRVIVLSESGYAEALLGLGLSYGQTSGQTWEEFLADNVMLGKLEQIARKLSAKDSGENKFLESIAVWLDIQAPRFWWQQMATYRIGVSTQSESTMRTLLRRPFQPNDFEFPLPQETWARLQALVDARQLTDLKNELPEGFLQRRIVCASYKSLRHIIGQRHNHRLPQWQVFCRSVVDQVRHPEFIVKTTMGEKGALPNLRFSQVR